MRALIRKNLFPTTTKAEFLGPAAALTFFGLCCICTAYIHVTGDAFPFDDSFITFRYVSNLFKGHGLVYNVDERIFGSTTPLYIVWLIFLKALLPFVEIPSLAVRGNIIFYIGSGFGFLFLFRRLLGSWGLSAIAAGLFLLQFDMLIISMGGNEPFLLCFLILWAFCFLLNEKYILAGLFAGLSIMARPEGIFCAVVVGLVWLLNDRKKLVRLFAAMVTPGLVWTVFGFAYYGTPIYHSLIAKARPVYPLPRGFAFRSLMGAMAAWTPGAGYENVMLWVVLLLACAGLVIRKGGHRKTWYVTPLFLGFILLFYGVGNPLVFSWYFPIVFVGWYVLVIAGFASLLLEATERLLHRYNLENSTRLTSTICMTIPLLIFAVSGNLLWRHIKFDTMPPRFPDTGKHFLSTITYRDAAEFINDVGGPADTIVAPEIGVLGYYSNHHIYDSCGLVSPEALPFLPVPYGRRVGPAIGSIPADFAKAVNADWIVTTEVFAIESLVEDPWFRKNYSLIKKFSLPFYGERQYSKNVLLYRHR